MSMAWVAVGTAALGAGVSVYGANKNAKAMRDAQAANEAAQKEAARQDWMKYLMQRGIAPNANTQVGEIPTGGAAINTRLPLWMQVQSTPRGVGTSKYVRKGTVQMVNRAADPTVAAPAAPAPAPTQEEYY